MLHIHFVIYRCWKLTTDRFEICLIVAETTCSQQPSKTLLRFSQVLLAILRLNAVIKHHVTTHTRACSFPSALFHRSFPSADWKWIPTAGQTLFTTCYPHTSPSSTLSALSFLHSFRLPHMFSGPPPISSPSNLYLGAMLAAPTRAHQAFQHYLPSLSYTLMHKQSP